MGEIKQVDNKIIIDDNSKWVGIIYFLKRRGFKITKNSYYEKHYKCLSKDHKTGSRGEVCVSLERRRFDIVAEFGHKKNQWDDMHNFWPKWHDRFISLTYLEDKKVKLEIKRFLNYTSKWNYEFIQPTENLSDIEQIIIENKINSHIHGPNINNLDDIAKYIENNDIGSYGTDKNGKKLICGETKYFYDYGTKRLFKGVVYHHINNMWWVLLNGERRNIACFRLFDYSPTLPKKQKLSEQELVQRWKSEIKIAEKQRNYKKAEALWKKVDKYTLYNVWSISNKSWFSPNSCGYTNDKEKAGVFTKQEINSHIDYYDNKKTTKAVLIE